MLRSASAVVAVTILVAFSFTEFWKQRNLLKKQRAELNSGFEQLVLRYIYIYVLIMMRYVVDLRLYKTY